MIMKDVAYNPGNKKITDELNEEQLRELEEAILEADTNETSDWDGFNKEMYEWKKR